MDTHSFIETKSSQLQSKKKRQELINVLAEQGFSQFTASSLEVTFSILDTICAEVKKIEAQIKEMTKDGRSLCKWVEKVLPKRINEVTSWTENIE